MGITRFLLIFLLFFGAGIPSHLKAQSDTAKTYQWNGRSIRYHKVEKGKTLYSISREYGIPQDSIIAINPELSKGLKTGMVIRIPWGKPQPKESDETYVVKSKETLYSISKKFGISVDELTEMNPEVKDGLKEGMVLSISKPTEKQKDKKSGKSEKDEKGTSVKDGKEKEKKKEGDEKPEEPKSEKSFLEGIFKSNPCKPVGFEEVEREIVVGLMLPFYLNGTDEYNPRSKIGLDFYSGAKIAFDSLEKRGLKLKVNVYDTQADSNKVRGIISKSEFLKNEIIIGPLYSSDFSIIANFSDKNKINAVSPFSQNDVLTEKHPYVLKVSPDNQTMLEEMCKFLANRQKNAIFTLIRNANAKDKEMADIMLAALIANKVPATQIKDVTYSGVSEILEGLTSNQENYLLFPSTVQIQVIDVISRLSAGSLGKRITLVGLNEWNNFENIDYDHLNTLNFTYAATSQSDFSSEASLLFQKKYKEENKAEPSMYAFHGYDVTMYVVSQLAAYGKSFPDCQDKIPPFCGINSCFQFIRDSDADGLENKFVNIMQLDDFQAKRLNTP